MTWVIQAAVVLAVPLTLLGAVRTGVYLIRKTKEFRTASAATAIDILLSGMPGISHFKDWLADLVDGTSDGGASSGIDASSDGGEDACHAGGD